MSKEVDGGKICAACKGACCHACNLTVGYFANYRTDLKNFHIKKRANVPDRVYELCQLIYQMDEADKKWGMSNQTFDRMAQREKWIKELTPLLGGAEFLPDLGFRSPNGCRIPRELRSEICLTYACEKLDRLTNQK